MTNNVSLFSGHHIVIHRVRQHTDVTTGSTQDPLRLDLFLKERYTHRSREKLKSAIEEGRVTIKRALVYKPVGRVKPSTQLENGDEVQVLTERKPEPEVDFNYTVLFEDDSLLVIEKPGNLPVHPSGRFYFHTLLIHLRTRGFQIPLEADLEYFLVHRIDRETSGLMVIAKTSEAASHFQKQFANRETKKKYLAIVHGWPALDEFENNTPMARKPGSAIRLQMAAVPIDEGGQDAKTGFKVLKRFQNDSRKFSLIECYPRTGRQHQIRLHLALDGHPIVGDKLYSLDEKAALQFFDHPLSTRTIRYVPAEIQARLILDRHALHAAGLSFTHPVTGQKMEFESLLASDLKNFVT